MKQRIKINGIIIFCSFCAIVFFPRVFFRPLSNWLFEILIALIGLALILLGQWLRISARGFKAEHSQNGHALIQDGPYGLVRNPMYLGILHIGFGIILILFKWWVLVLFLAVFALRYVRLIFEEERLLTKAFPESFSAYHKRTPCLVPSLNILLRRGIRECLSVKPGWIKKEIGSVIAVISAVVLLSAWRAFVNL